MIESASASLHRICGDRGIALVANDNTIESGTLNSAGNSSKIANIRDAIKNKKKWFTSFAVALVDNAFEGGILHHRQLTNYSLVIFTAQCIELLLRHKCERDFVRLGCVDQLANQIIVQSGLDKNFLDLTAGFDGFHHRAWAKNRALVFHQ